MLKRVLVVFGCFIVTAVVGTVNKFQRSLMCAPGQEIQQRPADVAHNCGLSCTRSGGQHEDRTAPRSV